ncbi:hypothetical protein FUAX_04900 [Fulvitalea axinellae]|uniref:Uncharacterized protein n=1 Tax=Fulvitalea axinellae TaxID=1182444 RepID=A0AAU9CJ95_9BACT|nr:hypothetical protein FUAX_04900 [Fulvitalea axinellae]
MRTLTVYLLFAICPAAIGVAVTDFHLPLPLTSAHSAHPLIYVLLAVLALVSSGAYEPSDRQESSKRSFIRLFLISLAGIVTGELILFVEWYWITHPEYRNVPGDMAVGVSWLIVFLAVKTVVIFFAYILGFGFRKMLASRSLA